MNILGCLEHPTNIPFGGEESIFTVNSTPEYIFDIFDKDL
jgi:hypothetical protein